MKLDDVKKKVRFERLTFDGDGHLFWTKNADDYSTNCKFAHNMMSLPSNERPRGWSRGMAMNGEHFTKIRLH